MGYREHDQIPLPDVMAFIRSQNLKWLDLKPAYQIAHPDVMAYW